jgi:hypothetical protein
MERTHNVAPIRDTDASDEAWKTTAAACKYSIHDGFVESCGGGAIYRHPAPSWFAGVPEDCRNAVFLAQVQYATNRIGQKGNQADVDAFYAHGKLVGALQSSDARERCYLFTVAAKVTAALPNATAEERVLQIKMAAAKPSNRAKFNAVVSAGLALGAATKTKATPTRARKTINTEGAVDIDA